MSPVNIVIKDALVKAAAAVALSLQGIYAERITTCVTQVQAGSPNLVMMGSQQSVRVASTYDDNNHHHVTMVLAILDRIIAMVVARLTHRSGQDSNVSTLPNVVSSHSHTKQTLAGRCARESQKS